ncbi:hypothetical protein OROMI_007986 [Orobanche minor]
MQCTSYIPVYHHLNGGSSGFSLHLLNSITKYGGENWYDDSFPPYNNMEQYLSYDKEKLRHVIQNHDTTFRHQVQELHRLYQKQRELMDEMRVRKVFSQRLLSKTTSESIHSRYNISQETSHATSWLLADHRSKNFQHPPELIPSHYIQEQTMPHAGPFVRKNSCNEVNFLSSRSNNGNNENINLDLELPADIRNLFRERNLSGAPELTCITPDRVPDIRPVTVSDIGSNLNDGKRQCFIDLNEPIELESLPSSSKCSMEIMHNSPCISNPKDSGFLNYDRSSDGINSLMALDLNSMPVDNLPETEINLEQIRTTKKETTADHPFANNKLLKTETDIDLNTNIVTSEPSSPPSSSAVQIGSGGDRDLAGPVSPENEECSPPRGKSEDIQLEQGEKEPSMELDIIAAHALAAISSCGAHGCLSWLAEIVSAAGDDLENQITELKNVTAYNDQHVVLSEENALNLSCVVEKKKETGYSSVVSHKGRARGTGRCKDTRIEVSYSPSKNVREIEGFFKTGSSRKCASKKVCAKPRNYSKLSSDRVKKPISYITRQPSTQSKHGVLQSWGKIRKREGGFRRKASKFLVISG